MTTKKKTKKTRKVKPKWTTVVDPGYNEYFVTQAQISRSIRNDDVVHLTFYDECLPSFPDKKSRKPLVERRVKTKLILPYNALLRLKILLDKVISRETVGRKKGDEPPRETDTPYIR